VSPEEDVSTLVAPLDRTELEPAAALLARSFRDAPMTRAVVGAGPRRRLRASRYGMRLLLESGYGFASMLGLRASSKTLAAVLVALPPGVPSLPDASLWAQLRCVYGQGWRVVARWGEVSRRLTAARPDELHAYLALLAVEPSHQGSGLGRALLEAWLEDVDDAEAVAYLETDRFRNLRFYASAGFGLHAHLHVHGQAVWTLRRATRATRPHGSPARTIS